MPLVCDSHHNFALFLHIPKTGGTSVEKQLRSLGYRLRLIENQISIDKNFVFKKTPQHLTLDVLEHILDLGKVDQMATVTRHPFDRLVSEFFWLKKNNICGSADEFLDDFLQQGRFSRFNIDNHLGPQIEYVNDKVTAFKLEENGVERCVQFFQKSALRPNPFSLRRLNFRTAKKKQTPQAQKQSTAELFARYRHDIEAHYADDMRHLGY